MAGRRATTILAATTCTVLAVASASAENVPLPTPAPQPKTGAAPAPPAANPRPAAGERRRAVAPGLLPVLVRRTRAARRRSTATAFDAKQRALLDQRQHLSVERADHGRQFRPGRARRRPHRRHVLYPEARQGALRVQSAEPDRHHRRRLLGGGARPQPGDPGSLSAVADAAALPARRPHRPSARHRRRQRDRPTTPSSPSSSRRSR